MWSSILEIVLLLLGGLNIFQLIFWRVQRDKLVVELENLKTELKQKQTDLAQDQYDYVFTQLSKLQKEYLDLQSKVRSEANEHSNVIQEKCNEIAELKSKVVYYKGLRCYRSDCGTRVCRNPKDNETKQEHSS